MKLRTLNNFFRKLGFVLVVAVTDFSEEERATELYFVTVKEWNKRTSQWKGIKNEK